MSPFHFNRVSKKITGESLHSYIRRVRLEHSANALLFIPDSSVTEILQSSGFASSSSSIDAFKEYFGVTPPHKVEKGGQSCLHRRKYRTNFTSTCRAWLL